jgi:predicted NodU family carbamoyl transferase
MKILGVNLNHDGSVAIVADGRLTIHIEAQKDSQARYAEISALTVDRLWTAVADLGIPEGIAVCGLFNGSPGYFGLEPVSRNFLQFPAAIRQVMTTHERAHILCSYGLSPFPQGQPCYALVYEGTIGSFYRIDEDCNIVRLCSPLSEPGRRYAALFEFADPTAGGHSQGHTPGVAGKLMALAATRETFPLDESEQDLLHALLDGPQTSDFSYGIVPRKEKLNHFPHFNVGHLDSRFRNFAANFSDALFDRFFTAAKSTLFEGLPLIISGGCGLNCDWNTRWRDCGIFPEVFVPPCPDDSGIAIGAAVDAQLALCGSAKLKWDVYAGESFLYDTGMPSNFAGSQLDYDRLVQLLSEGAVAAWVQDRYEIGPRALGNRSLLASPLNKNMTERLNRIKNRESYRPVAPVCCEDEVDRWFRWQGKSSYMLYFQQVLSERIPAVTHDDGSARVQTLTNQENPKLYRLLKKFGESTGVGVLCNTSLNFCGKGFINRTSDLMRYALDRDIDVVVLDNDMYVRR